LLCRPAGFTIQHERSFDHRGCLRAEIVLRQIVGISEDHFGHVGVGAQRTASRPAQVIHQHEVIHHPSLVVTRNAVEHFDHRAHAHLEPGLFEHLANQARFKRLADFDCPTGKAPLPGQRLVFPSYEQDLSFVHDHGTNADEGREILKSHLSDKLQMQPTMLDAAKKAVELAGSK